MTVNAFTLQTKRMKEGKARRKAIRLIRTWQLQLQNPQRRELEPTSGLEPLTCRLRIGCSTN
jgi:hypothetical protein